MTKERHPLEHMAEVGRFRENPYNYLTESSFMLTNFPGSETITEAFIRDMIKSVDEKVIINKVELFEAMQGSDPSSEYRGRTSDIAYAVVDFEFDH